MSRKNSRIHGGWIGMLLTIVVISIILFLTLMPSENTMHLSESFRIWLNDHGISVSSEQLRSDIHIFEYFPLGFTLCLWIGWKKSIIIGSLLGLADEILKIYLPTRHFSWIDAAKDAIGVILGTLAALLIINFISKQKNK